MGSRNFPLENAAAERSGLSPHFALRAKWWPEVESNHRHGDFQSPALPTELSGQRKVDTSAFLAAVKMTAAMKGVIKAKEVSGVK